MTHYFGPLGKYMVEWESHTEFVTCTIFGDGAAQTPFDAATFALFPDSWLADAPGVRIASALTRVEQQAGDDLISEKVADWFVPESLALSRVLDDDAVIAGDFRIDPAGLIRFAIFARPETGARRTGCVLQRLCEIEIYKAMAMLGFSRTRQLGPQLGTLDGQ